MNPLSKILLGLMLTLTTATAFSQTATKPTIFGAYPNSINCSVYQFMNAFAATEGQHVVLSFSDNFKFSGTVISNIVKYDNLQSMTIRSDDSEKTIFHLSRQTLDGNIRSYVGRIMNPDAADGFEIKKDADNNYRFEKINATKTLETCHL